MLKRFGIKTTARLWIARAVVVNALSRLPFYEYAHFLLQTVLRRHRIDAEEMLGRALEQFRLLRHMGQGARDKVFLEIGTGWFPFSAILASLLGAKSVITVDIHPWLRIENVRTTVLCLEAFIDRIARDTGVPVSSLTARYAAMKERIAEASDLQSSLRHLSIDYRCPLDLTKSAWNEPQVDVVLSSNVLEHIPPRRLHQLHTTIASLLHPHGLCIHRFNPGDHSAALTGSSIHFLKYTDGTWSLLDGYGLSYHNRLRTPQYAQLIRGTGLQITLWAESVDQQALDQVRSDSIRLQPQFRDMDPESVCVHYAWWVLTLGQGDAKPILPRRVRWIDEILEADCADSASLSMAVMT